MDRYEMYLVIVSFVSFMITAGTIMFKIYNGIKKDNKEMIAESNKMNQLMLSRSDEANKALADTLKKVQEKVTDDSYEIKTLNLTIEQFRSDNIKEHERIMKLTEKQEERLDKHDLALQEHDQRIHTLELKKRT